MEALFAVLIGILVAAGVFLLLSRTIIRVVLGLAFISYGVNLAILTVAGLRENAPPLLTLPGPYVDPLPQALVLTAIVIGFGTTALLLTVALRAYQVAGHDDVEAFGDSLARDPAQPDGLLADPERLGPDLPDLEDAGNLPGAEAVAPLPDLPGGTDLHDAVARHPHESLAAQETPGPPLSDPERPPPKQGEDDEVKG